MTIERAISLLNVKSTTIDDLCSELFSHVESYQQEREAYYLSEFEEKVNERPEDFDSERIEDYTNDIFKEIASDSKEFIKSYTTTLSDGLLDAMNDKKVDKKACKLFLTILSVMEEVLIKAFNLED